MTQDSASRLSTKRRHEMLRVDHAGEYAAVAIYKGQIEVLSRMHGKEDIVEQLREMEADEQEHLDAFDAYLQTNRARPTALAPVWNVAGFALGAATALLGDKAAHACTEAVETVIEDHYNDQIDELEDAGETELAAHFTKIRDEEIAHREHAEDHGAHEAPAYPLLSAIIKTGCRVAIKISEKV